MIARRCAPTAPASARVRNAICDPSGDQLGDPSGPGPAASLRGAAAPESTPTIQISEREPSSAFGVGDTVTASWRESGDQSASLADTSPSGSSRTFFAATSSTCTRGNAKFVSTTIASSRAFCLRSSSAVGARGARNTICLPSGDQLKPPTAVFVSAIRSGSPPVGSMLHNCGRSSRFDTKAILDPSGDQRGETSRFLPAVNRFACAPPSARTNQIAELIVFSTVSGVATL